MEVDIMVMYVQNHREYAGKFISLLYLSNLRINK